MIHSPYIYFQRTNQRQFRWFLLPPLVGVIRLNENLEQQAQALYYHMFVENMSPKWDKGTLSDIADITMGQSPSGSSYNEEGEGTIFFQGRAEQSDR
mgnify:FL=1